MRFERMDKIPEMCVMTRLIWSQCVQTLVRRNTVESSRNLKHIKVNLVPDQERINPPVRTPIRAGYGVYRNTSVYQSIEMLLAQQPPLSKSLSVESTAANPLTLANGFVSPPNATTNTFAVDPDFRVGYAHNWQALLQRDLPASLTMTVTYLGTKGSHLMQESLPNTYPAGAVNPCPACPSPR